MYTTILLAAALQDWERYSTHALAARDVAALRLERLGVGRLHVDVVRRGDILLLEPDHATSGILDQHDVALWRSFAEE